MHEYLMNLRRFEHSDVIKIRDGITLDFYMGLPCVTAETANNTLEEHQVMFFHKCLAYISELYIDICGSPV